MKIIINYESQDLKVDSANTLGKATREQAIANELTGVIQRYFEVIGDGVIRTTVEHERPDGSFTKVYEK